MKVNPSLFPQDGTPPRQNSDASEARRAFEAMLSASTARTRAAQAPLTAPVISKAGAIGQTSQDQNKETTVPKQLSRPGRVLDIKV